MWTLRLGSLLLAILYVNGQITCPTGTNLGFSTLFSHNRAGGLSVATGIGLEQCKQLCQSSNTCYGIDWNVARRECFFFTSQGAPQANPCCVHCAKICVSPVAGVVTPVPATTVFTPAATNPITTTGPNLASTVTIGDSGKCPDQFQEFPDSSMPQGTLLSGTFTAETCKTACLGNTSCLAVDFFPATLQCYRHDSLNLTIFKDGTEVGSFHYRKTNCNPFTCYTHPTYNLLALPTGITIAQLFYIRLNSTAGYRLSTVNPIACTGACQLTFAVKINTTSGGFQTLEANITRQCNLNFTREGMRKGCDTASTVSTGETITDTTCFCDRDRCNGLSSSALTDCVGYYPLDCTTEDHSGNFRMGNGVNVKWDAFDMKKNWSAVFDGSAYITIPSFRGFLFANIAPDTGIIKPEATIALWYKRTNATGDMTLLANGFVNNAPVQIRLTSNDTGTGVSAGFKLNTTFYEMTGTLPVDTWNFIVLGQYAITGNTTNTQLRLYLGGDNVASDTFVQTVGPYLPVASGAGDLCIGKQPIPDNFWFAPGEFFIGKIDEIYMFTRSLTVSDLQSIHDLSVAF